jgi:hypothetical protein
MTLATSTELKSWQEKRGGFYQHDTHHSLDCSHMDELRVRLRASSEALARSALHGVQVDATSLQLVDIKLLRAARGHGLQEVHYDVPEYEKARQCYTVLLYLTPTESTAVPKVPLSELRDTFTDGEKRPPAAALHMLRRNNFHTRRVEAGDLLVFNAAVPHFGVANPDLHDRYVLFLLFSPRGTPLHDSEDQRYPFGIPATPRSKRPYEALKSTQQWQRRKTLQAEVEAAVKRVGCPLDAIQHPPTAPPAEVIHLPTSVREQIRTVPSLHISSEQTIIQCKNKLATTHATRTATFANGAYITDPVRYVSGLCLQSSLLVVGGDTGDGLTKLGVTYVVGEQQRFAALLVYRGKDNYEDLGLLRQPGLFPFTGDSQHHASIFEVLQYLIDAMKAFLNGDWPFINTLLGLKNASAIHPCPICRIKSSNLLKTASYRQPRDSHSRHRNRDQLITIDSERIVPTPLHLFLGISNRIILNAFSELFGTELVEEALKAVTTIHSAGCGGKSDLFELNGPEISKWLKKKCSSSLCAAAEKENTLTADQIATHSVLSLWLKQLHDHLLHKKEWTPKQIEEWRTAVDDIQQHWCAETHSNPFPKLHMLRHSLEFAERHRFLGRASEAQIESYHYQYKMRFHQHHLNMAHDEPERLRRCLADTTLHAVQPLVLAAQG